MCKDGAPADLLHPCYILPADYRLTCYILVTSCALLQVGGLGLTLTAADRVIIIDPNCEWRFCPALLSHRAVLQCNVCPAQVIIMSRHPYVLLPVCPAAM